MCSVRTGSALALGLAAATAALVATPAATASPLIDPYLGGVVFTGPAHGHPTAIYFNPAAMRLASGTHVFLSGSLRLDQTRIERAPIDAAGLPGGDRDLEPVSALTGTPGGYAAVFTDFNGDRVTAGIATYTPFAERFIDGEDPLRYHTLGGHAYEWFVTPAVAIRVNSKIAVGLGVSFSALSSLQLRTARDTALEGGGGSDGLQSDCDGAACGAENPLATETLDVAVREIFGNFAFHLGATLRPADGWTIGVGYVSPPSQFGTLRVSNDGRVDGQAAPRDGGDSFSGRARVTYSLPQSLQIGVRGAVFDRWDLVVNGRWITTGRQKRLDIRVFGDEISTRGVPENLDRYRNLDDLVILEAGLENRERERLRFGGRIRVSNGGVSTEDISPLSVESFNAAAAVGAEVRVTEQIAVTAGYAIRVFAPRDVNPGNYDPAARVACTDSGFDFDLCDAFRDGRAIPTAAGNYSRLQHAFTLALRYDTL